MLGAFPTVGRSETGKLINGGVQADNSAGIPLDAVEKIRLFTLNFMQQFEIRKAIPDNAQGFLEVLNQLPVPPSNEQLNRLAVIISDENIKSCYDQLIELASIFGKTQQELVKKELRKKEKTIREVLNLANAKVLLETHISNLKDQGEKQISIPHIETAIFYISSSFKALNELEDRKEIVKQLIGFELAKMDPIKRENLSRTINETFNEVRIVYDTIGKLPRSYSVLGSQRVLIKEKFIPLENRDWKCPGTIIAVIAVGLFAIGTAMLFSYMPDSHIWSGIAKKLF